MKNYSYHIIGTSIIENRTGLETIQAIKKKINSFYGKAKFEYWSQCGNFSGEAYA